MFRNINGIYHTYIQVSYNTKETVMHRQILFLIIILSVAGCDSGIDKSLILDKEKLYSPDNSFILYRYTIESSMAFGSPITVMKILPSDKECDYSDQDFLRFGNDHPFWIRWKNQDTIIVKCLADGEELQDKQPFKKETQKWKDWTLEVEYYSVFSSSLGGNYELDNYVIDSNQITFNSKEKSLTFMTNEIQMVIDSNKIDLTHVGIDTFQTKLGLALTSYSFKNYRGQKLGTQNIFIKENE